MPKTCGFILAAGEGRRMRPATLNVPKALLPFCGRPLLNLTASSLKTLPEISGIVVNACYLGEQVRQVCGKLEEEMNFPVFCSMEEKLLNHGGGIRKGILENVPDAEEIFIHNVDIVHDFPLQKLLAVHREQADNAATLLLVREPRGVTVNEDGTIRSFYDRTAEESFTFSGIYIIKREILDFLPADEEAPSILDAFRSAAAAGRRIAAFIADANVFWSDVGTVNEYIRAHGTIADMGEKAPRYLREAVAVVQENRAALEAQGVVCSGIVAPGKNVSVCPGSVLHNVVLWDNALVPRQVYCCQGIMYGESVSSDPLPPYQKTAPDQRILDTMEISVDQLIMEDFPRQASGRHYARLILPDGKRRIWCAYSVERQENAYFAVIADFLKCLGIRVPAVLVHLPDTGEMLLEDLGETDMLNLPHEALADATADVLQQVAILHSRGPAAAEKCSLHLQPPFDAGLYTWERGYFCRQMLQGVLGAGRLWDDEAEKEWQSLRDMMLAQPLVTLHRDLQSANVKITAGRTWLIDFQGMRLGAAVYDLASLLYDPYLERTPEQRDAGWKCYCLALAQQGVEAPPEEAFHAAALQRLMQALGAYGKLWRLDGLDRYRSSIAPALRNIISAAEKTTFTKLASVFREAQKLWEAHPEYVAPGKN